jgi:hypothetical protein
VFMVLWSVLAYDPMAHMVGDARKRPIPLASSRSQKSMQ